MDWKILKRHPLSAEYADMNGDRWDALVADIKENGFDITRPIVLADDQVLDGWQRLRACIECDVEPAFASLQDGLSPEQYVRRHNDNRRHETAKEREQRINRQRQERQERRKRVSKARAEGKSIRQIAEEEGVDHATVLRDTEHSEPESSGAEVSSAPLDEGKPGFSEEPPVEEPVDDNGIPWSTKAPNAVAAVTAAPKLKELSRKIAGIIAECNDESIKLYSFSMQSVVASLKTAKETLLGGRPAYVCPYCDGTLTTKEGGRAGKRCEVCCLQGWVTKSVYERSPKGAAK